MKRLLLLFVALCSMVSVSALDFNVESAYWDYPQEDEELWIGGDAGRIRYDAVSCTIDLDDGYMLVKVLINGKVYMTNENDYGYNHFSISSYKIDYFNSIEVVYHKHGKVFTDQAYEEPTCCAKGKRGGVWCDCGAFAEDDSCLDFGAFIDNELAIDPTNHVDPLVEVQAQHITPTCSQSGVLHHWYCSHCHKGFSDATGTQETSMYEPLDPTNHALAVVNKKVHCEWCEQDFPHFLVIDDNPVLLDGETGNYALDNVELKYGHTYLCSDDFKSTSSTYTFPVNEGVWNSWFVPFAIKTSELEANGFTAAYIAGIRQYEKDEQGNLTTQVDIIKITNAELFAGTPYLIKGGDASVVTLQLADADFAASSHVRPVHTETATAAYDFIGSYESVKVDAADGGLYYFMGSNGSLKHSANNSFNAIDWYMKVTAKDAVYRDLSLSQPQFISLNVIGEEDGVTGLRTIYPAAQQEREIYDLSGRRLSAPKAGQVNLIGGKKMFVK